MKKALNIFIAVLLTGIIAAIAWPQNAHASGAEPITSFNETVTEAEGPGVTLLSPDKWGTTQMKSMSGGAALSSSATGAAFEYMFSGASVAADMIVDRSGGMFSVFVDGKELKKIDLYRNRMGQGTMRMALANNLTQGSHILKIEILGERNPKSLGSFVIVDTLRVASAPYGAISGVLECQYNTGMPVMRAKVSATGNEGELNIVTDTSGKFVFDALVPDTYTLHFEHPGFTTLEQTGLIVKSGQSINLQKVLFEESIGARPLKFIRYPLAVRPVIVRPGDEFIVEVAAPESAGGWQAALETPWTSAPLEIKSASINTANGLWNVTVAVPSGVSSLLHGLRLKFKDGEDFQPRAVMVVPAFKDSIKVVHLTDVHVYKSEILFERYPLLAEEINLINPDVIVVTGDLTDSNGYTDERWPESDQYPAMLELWDSYYSPTFILPGNHDLSPYKYDDDYFRWNSYFGVTDFSFDVGPYHFTAFDNAFTMVSMTKKEAYREDLFPEQLTWLENDLASNMDAKMRIIAYHVPLHNTNSKVKELASKYDVDLALYGHLHLDQVDNIPPTTYVQTGAAYDGSYRVLNLDNGKIGEISTKKNGYTAFTIGTLKTAVQTSPDGNVVTVKVRNKSSRMFSDAAWQADMPTAQEYTCDGCTITGRFVNGNKTHVVFSFDIKPKEETTVILSVK
ncbi:MAG: metallophosphoesterase [bacterium]